MKYRIHKITMITHTDKGDEIKSIYREDETNDLKAYRAQIKMEFGCDKVALAFETRY